MTRSSSLGKKLLIGRRRKAAENCSIGRVTVNQRNGGYIANPLGESLVRTFRPDEMVVLRWIFGENGLNEQAVGGPQQKEKKPAVSTSSADWKRNTRKVLLSYVLLVLEGLVDVVRSCGGNLGMMATGKWVPVIRGEWIGSVKDDGENWTGTEWFEVDVSDLMPAEINHFLPQFWALQHPTQFYT
ncbi:hypothetical protein TWF481_009415 [Arthrobotrys musiformis]|uniref:Uncharacterized protein n=1 Tax=Arthrobotrys musiformis TaxID=47236 RepID=A0AAV9W3S2_9PEZI